MKQLIYIYICWNGITFMLMGIDKYKAKHGQWRISENTLIATAFLMGGVGAILGGYIFRHKTRKTKFRIMLPVSIVFNLAIMYLVLYAF